ncbi:MAG: hypothetical protein KC983_01600, partial [Phycisphaerales bacterium]|nr:hypothetical protein [Phycisphaerales bacterium]
LFRSFAIALAVSSVHADERVSTNDKGSLFWFPKVEIRWDQAGNLRKDTFISLTNDYPGTVQVQMYFVNGDPPLAADPLAAPPERAHPGWNWVDNLITLTGDQPTFWSVLTGNPAGVSPFATALDPGFPPGRPALDGTGDRVMRGFIVGWAVNSSNRQISWNHLSGTANFIDYANSTNAEYSSFNYRSFDDLDDPTGIAGIIEMDDSDYNYSHELLLLHFQASGSTAMSGPVQVAHDTELTLMPCSLDVRQESVGPVTTKASFEVWNQNELKFSGAHRCITCWDSFLLSNLEGANHFRLATLQTNMGKARIDGLKSQLCDVDFDPNNNVDFPFPPGPADPRDPRDVVSQNTALLGIAERISTFPAGNGRSANHLVGMGEDDDCVIRYDIVGPPPSNPTQIFDWLDREIRKAPRTNYTDDVQYDD